MSEFYSETRKEKPPVQENDVFIMNCLLVHQNKYYNPVDIVIFVTASDFTLNTYISIGILPRNPKILSDLLALFPSRTTPPPCADWYYHVIHTVDMNFAGLWVVHAVSEYAWCSHKEATCPQVGCEHDAWSRGQIISEVWRMISGTNYLRSMTHDLGDKLSQK